MRNTNRRPRGRNNNRSKGPNRAQVYDSNGPEVRIRGTAHQICEKYEALAKDARSTGDTVLAESYLQHAEHYQRIVMVLNEKLAAHRGDNKKAYDGNKQQVVEGNKKENGSDDLSLPSSILGEEVKADAEPVRELAEA
jgi:hypothetical protein